MIGEPVSNPPIGILFPENGLANDAHTKVNAALIDVITSPAFKPMQVKWFPDNPGTAKKEEEKIEWGFVATSIAVVVLYLLLQIVVAMRAMKSKKSSITPKLNKTPGDGYAENESPRLKMPSPEDADPLIRLESKLDRLLAANTKPE